MAFLLQKYYPMYPQMNKVSRTPSNTQIVVSANKTGIKISKGWHKLHPAFWQKETKRYESETENILN